MEMTVEISLDRAIVLISQKIDRLAKQGDKLERAGLVNDDRDKRMWLLTKAQEMKNEETNLIRIRDTLFRNFEEERSSFPNGSSIFISAKTLADLEAENDLY